LGIFLIKGWQSFLNFRGLRLFFIIVGTFIEEFGHGITLFFLAVQLQLFTLGKMSANILVAWVNSVGSLRVLNGFIVVVHLHLGLRSKEHCFPSLTINVNCF
jgi:hypothetical protein